MKENKPLLFIKSITSFNKEKSQETFDSRKVVQPNKTVISKISKIIRTLDTNTLVKIITENEEFIDVINSYVNNVVYFESGKTLDIAFIKNIKVMKV